ncbi:MAG: SufE family protein [Parvibaculum sp.]|jgi:cysteine desulfuration protein SufE|uniref:SufE family protein n=1 Tax=Parvibaculum sp. TaxID=2024848 RepID=UPI00283CBAAA|nr:SufE family protein [Parvibaculum sp.]MDR3497777.1 SufE family protein [Parvibaculum sp.]
MSIEDLIEDFSFLDDWEERYRYVIELGKTLEPLSDEEHSPANKVEGCVSQVWLVTEARKGEDGGTRLVFRGDSDAFIVRGLIAILLRIYSGRTPAEIDAIEARPIFEKLGLNEHLSPQRSNGLYSMVGRVKADAKAQLAALARG